jgi:hypothetical protein
MTAKKATIAKKSTVVKKPSTAKGAPKSIARTTNAIGLDSVQAKELAEKLNDLLANYQLFLHEF